MRALQQHVLLFNVWCALNGKNEGGMVTTWKCIEKTSYVWLDFFSPLCI